MSATVGIVHPGQMGSSIGAALRSVGHRALWCAEQRSEATRARARADGLEDAGSFSALLERCTTLISVCPPDAAASVANAVAARGFDGVYVDANAISPRSARAIAARVEAAGAHYVDGGILGPPARGQGVTLLYLSGASAAAVGALFTGSALWTHVIGPDAGQASALKMAFGGWTKGSAALLLGVRALAQAEGVADALAHAFGQLAPDLGPRLEQTAARQAPKAWRFAGEMREIAATFEAAGLPEGFHAAAAELYARLSDFKDAPSPALDEVMARLLR